MHDPSTPDAAGATVVTPEGKQQPLAPGAQNGTPAYAPPDYTGPDYTGPGYTGPGHTAPGHTAPGHTGPDHTTPGYVAPGPAASGHVSPEPDAPVYPSYYPSPPPPASGAKKLLLVVAAGVGVLFMAAILAAVAIPTFLSVKAGSSGTTWFSGGVAGWPTVKAAGLGTGGTIVETWQVQGANFKGPGPYMAVVRTGRQVPTGETASQYFLNLAQGLRSDGDDADVTALSNGYPAVEWAKVGDFGAGSSDYYLYAYDGSTLYMVYLEASTKDFSKALDIARPVMLNFKGTG